MTDPRDSPTAKPRNRKRHARRPQLITDDDYALLLAAQGGACAICRNPPKRVKLNTDHDHRRKDRAVRGLLCHRCNRALPAWITVEWLRKAIGYMTEPPAFAVLAQGEYDGAPMDGDT